MPATLRCRCGLTKDKLWHLVCCACWPRLPTVLQIEVNEAYQERRRSWDDPELTKRHTVAMRQCLTALGPISSQPQHSGLEKQ